MTTWLSKEYYGCEKLVFWSGMGKSITKYIERCMKCQKVKVEHGHPT